MKETHILLIVAIVALAAAWSVSTPTGALAGVNCVQVISSDGVGAMICDEDFEQRAQRIFPVRGAPESFEPGNEQRGLDWKEREGIHWGTKSSGSYDGLVEMRGGGTRMFSGEDYVQRRVLQRSETFK